MLQHTLFDQHGKRGLVPDGKTWYCRPIRCLTNIREDVGGGQKDCKLNAL